MIAKYIDQWIIEARAFKIPYTPFSHNFWVLLGPGGVIEGQIHGLAVDPATGRSQAIGSARYLLQAVSDACILWSLQPGQVSCLCAAGSWQEIAGRWQAALAAIPAINELKLSYPNLWQHALKPNSNSVFNTIGLIMGFAAPSRLLPAWAPGVNKIISAEIIRQYCYCPPPPRRHT
ncbi:MAG: hypothetical protein N2491_02400 [Negativicutes bacterium]|nr:hypothetical protein [Negativicutes bacterium]